MRLHGPWRGLASSALSLKSTLTEALAQRCAVSLPSSGSREMTDEHSQLVCSTEFLRRSDAPMTIPELTDALRLIDLKLTHAIPEFGILQPGNQAFNGRKSVFSPEPLSATLARLNGAQTQWSRFTSTEVSGYGTPRSAPEFLELRQKHIEEHIGRRRASMQQLLIEVAEAKKDLETSLELPQNMWEQEGQVSAEWEPLAHVLTTNSAFPFPEIVDERLASRDSSPYAMRIHSHQPSFSNSPRYVTVLEKLRKAQDEYSELTAPELWMIKIRLLERLCKFDSEGALAVKREQEMQRMEQETAAAERVAEEARRRAEAMREQMNSARV